MPKTKCCNDYAKTTECYTQCKPEKDFGIEAYENDKHIIPKITCSKLIQYLNSNRLEESKATKSKISKKKLKKINNVEENETAEKSRQTKDMFKVDNLCEMLDCPQISFQIEKLTTAQDQLMHLQQRQLFDHIFGIDFLCFPTKKQSKPSIKKATKSKQFEYLEMEEAEKLGEEEEFVCFASEIMELLPEQEWHGFFRGYDILTEQSYFSLNENKKCIELTHQDTVENMEVYLRAGVRCFMIDLFKGNNQRNQTIVVRFRQSELNVARELGFPITSTLFARLSPRLQYTGYLEGPLECVILCENDIVTLTTDRYWAHRSSNCRIFVNARYLLPDIHCFDIILIGSRIQLLVKNIMEDSVLCKVLHSGKLYSHMPVLFNSRCPRFRLSFCELEDITFVKEVGINVIVSDILGTKSYFDDLIESLKLLDCENLRIFARVVVNNIEDDETDVSWAAKSYDGFLGELSQFRDGCGGDGNITDLDEDQPSTARILFLNPKIRKLVECARRQHKPFIFDPTPLVSGQYIMDPECYKTVLYHPDKYLISREQNEKNTTFYLLANALGAPMPEAELQLLMPYCDKSHTGSDTLALATAAASMELNASCIFVVGFTGRMATKIASFRPRATIYFISGLKSVANYLSIHHNVVMLYYDTKMIEASHQRTVYTQFLFALSYAIKLKALKDGQHVIFVYGQKAGQLLLDKYIAYKFDAKHFIRDLAAILF